MPVNFQRTVTASQRTGVVPDELDPTTYPLRPSSAEVTAATYGVLVYWPADTAGWLRIAAEVDDAGRATPLDDTEAAAARVLDQFKARAMVVGGMLVRPDWRRQNRFLIGSMASRAVLRVRFALDTNSEGFCEAASRAIATAGPGVGARLTVPVVVTYFTAAGPAGRQEVDATTVALEIGPLLPAGPDLDYYLAVDVGNTSTAVACLDRVRDGTAAIEMLQTMPLERWGGEVGQLDPGGSPIPSEVQFDLIRTWIPTGAERPVTRKFPSPEHPRDHRLNAVLWKVGHLARVGPPRGIVFGAKRLAAVRQPRHALTVAAEHRVVPEDKSINPSTMPNVTFDVDYRAPLELLACRVFQYYREARGRRATHVALTYPTTYGRFEAMQLRRAVQKGWLRSQNRPQGLTDDAPPAGSDPDDESRVRSVQALVNADLGPDAQDDDPVVQHVFDEASAAGFFHLYRRIFEEQVLGLAGFKLHYEWGLNLLLYDCGGGTTDIALVKAAVDPAGETLVVNVPARSGVRDFGGDNITRELCRLLKAKLIALVIKKSGRPDMEKFTRPLSAVTEPTRAGTGALSPEDLVALGPTVRQYIDRVFALDPQDSLVPTKCPRGGGTEERRARFAALWRYAEDLKKGLQSAESVSLPAKERDTDPLTQAIFPTAAAQVQQFKADFQKVTIHRWEVDALVAAEVLRTIDNCNELIARTLAGQSPPQEVHWVVASGNAIKYPLVRRLLEERLAVSQLADGRFTYDEQNAKDATAKGAVLALATLKANGTIALKFDSDLYNRLPYDVAYMDDRVHEPVLLFQEHTHYRELTTADPQPVPRAALAAGPAATARPTLQRQFVLLRRFPGDRGFTKFLRYDFPDGVTGNLTVRYDPNSPFEFVAADETGRVGDPYDLTADDVYLAPAQACDF